MSADQEVNSSGAYADPIIAEARKRWDRCSEWESSSRLKFLEDLKFANGDSDNGYQWPANIRQSRDTDSRPCLTMNVLRQHNLQISNEARKNKSSVKIIPLGGGSTSDSAMLFADIARHVEYISNAQAAFTMARNFQIDGGIGWWRVVTDYVSPETFDQDIYVLPVKDPLSIYMDPDIQQKDGSDAHFAFVFDTLPEDEFDEAYPKFKGQASLSPLGIGSVDDWVARGSVRVCEYFRKVFKDDELFSFIHLGQRKTVRGSFLTPEMKKALKSDKLTKVRETQIESIEWKLIVGEKIIDETDWPGKYIPLVRVIGEETTIDGVLDRKGHTRAMKDAQRMYNYNALLALDTPIPTPSGWTTIGQLTAGSEVFDQNGLPVKVKEVLPIHENEKCFRITFDNGYSVVTDAGHIWRVEERGKRTAKSYSWADCTVSTIELQKGKHFIKVPKALKLPEKTLLVDPYVLGSWLGDGHSSSGRISAHEDDATEQKALFAELGYEAGEVVLDGENTKGVRYTVLALRGKLDALGVLNDKHVPAEYLRGSRNQRLGLLQGLMDTDGHYAEPVHQCIFVNTNPRLAGAVLELCASLGIKATINKQPSQASIFPDGKLRVSQENYRIQFTADSDLPIFRLYRKAVKQTAGRNTHWRRYKRIGIKSVEPIVSVPARCITLDTPDHLFLCTEGMIPTHNSAQVEFVALQGKTPWVASIKAIEGVESMWNTANTTNHSVLIYNSNDDEGNEIKAPERTPPPTAAPAYEMGMNTAFNQMMMTSGQWQNQMGMQGNERTGAAIGKRQEQGATATFHFEDNYEDALRFTGKIIIDLVPKVYDTKRVLTIQAADETDMEVEINPAAKQALELQMARNGKVARRIFNPQIGLYNVAAKAGPAYGSKREQTVEALTLILTQAPALTGLVGDLLLSSMDFDKAQEAAQRLKRMVPPQALGDGPSPEEQKLQEQVRTLTLALGKALTQTGKDQVKLIGKAQARDIDVYKAKTDRLKTLLGAIPPEQMDLRDLIQQLIDDSEAISLKPIVEANKDDIDNETVRVKPDSQVQSSDQNSDQNSGAPVPGAKRAPDGQWYLEDPTRKGKYLRIGPEVIQGQNARPQ